MFSIRLARPDDFKAILDLVFEAATWLHENGSDQWQKPWPDEPARNARILRGLLACQTWIVEDHGRVAATVTSKPYGSEDLWRESERAVPACYVSRLVVGRDYAGQRLGEALVDWVEARAWEQDGARSTRIDVWTTNVKLHGYYQRSGFTFVRFSEDCSYPSAALFERPISGSPAARGPRLHEVLELPAPTGRASELPMAPLVRNCRVSSGRPESLGHPARLHRQRSRLRQHAAGRPITPTGTYQSGLRRISVLYGVALVAVMALVRLARP